MILQIRKNWTFENLPVAESQVYERTVVVFFKVLNFWKIYLRLIAKSMSAQYKYRFSQ